MQKGYNFLNDAELRGEIGTVEKSLELFSEAEKLLPGNKEVLFWKAFMFNNRERKVEAQEILDKNFQGEEMWGELWGRIEESSCKKDKYYVYYP